MIPRIKAGGYGEKLPFILNVVPYSLRLNRLSIYKVGINTGVIEPMYAPRQEKIGDKSAKG